MEMTEPRRTRARIERGTSITLGAHVDAEAAEPREQGLGIDLRVGLHDTRRGGGASRERLRGEHRRLGCDEIAAARSREAGERVAAGLADRDGERSLAAAEEPGGKWC